MSTANTLLHITNGDGAVSQIKDTGIAGEVLPWRDPMHHGPFPVSNTPTMDSLDRLSRIRINYLRGDEYQSLVDRFKRGEVEADKSLHDFTERNELLERSHEFEEVVLWFEHDLLDQLQIVQLLSWFHHAEKLPKKLSLICIDQFEGVENFRGIGQLNSTQMASLFPQRSDVTPSHLRVANQVWQAFRSDEPNDLLILCQASPDPFPELPFLKNALLRYFQEFPWVSDGLTRTERQLLSMVSAGVTSPVKLFVDNMELEDALYIGDWRSYSHINDLCNGPTALLECAGGEAFMYPPSAELNMEKFREQRITITEVGKELLAGRESVLDSMHRDAWLGGVHLESARPMWCWDNNKSRLIKSTG